LRAGTAGTIANSIVTEMKNKAIEVQDKDAGTSDAHSKLISGEFKLHGNLFWANGSNTTLDASSTGIIRVTSGQPAQDDPDASDLIAHLIANNSTIANPGIRNISREQNEGLDPRPTDNGAAYTNPKASYPDGDDFFTHADYIGAFSHMATEFWINEWTTLSRNGHLADLAVGVKEVPDEQIAEMIRIYPNPVTSGSSFEIESSLEELAHIQLMSLDGRIVLAQKQIVSGRTTISIPNASSGLYFIKVITADGRFYTSMLIIE